MPYTSGLQARPWNIARVIMDENGKDAWAAGIFEHILRWASAQASVKVRLKTTNSHQAMLRWLVKNGFMFVAIEQGETPMENRIIAERPL